MGTIHLTPSTLDIYNNKTIDLHSAQKQLEIQEVVNKIVACNPSQICLEYPIENQSAMDSIYKVYLAGHYTLKDDERDLFGMQAAKKSGLKALTCINYSLAKFDADTVTHFALQNNQDSILLALKIATANFLQEINDHLSRLSLRNFLIYINSASALQNNLSMYTAYFAKVGKGNNYAGANLVADWYSTNIHIYSNILRIIQPADQTIFVIFGQGHIPILKHLFSNNPNFEVVELKDILK